MSARIFIPSNLRMNPTTGPRASPNRRELFRHSLVERADCCVIRDFAKFGELP